jgi:hypothetical protein
VNRGREFDDLYVHPPLLEAARLVIGRPFKLSSFRARSLHPHAAAGELHVDVQRGSADRPLLGFTTSHEEVGDVAEDRHYGPDQDHGPAVYVPMESAPFPPGTAVVRAEGSPDLPRQLHEAVWSVEPNQPVPLVRSMDEWASLAASRSRFDSWFSTVFGVLTLLLAAGGLYGTLIYTVGTERREIGTCGSPTRGALG